MVNVHRLFHQSMRRLPQADPARPQARPEPDQPATRPQQQPATTPQSGQMPSQPDGGGK